MNRNRTWTVAAVVFLAVRLGTGCFSMTSYQTADTVPKGGVEFGVGWSLTKLDKIAYTDSQGRTQETKTDKLGTIPNLLPDLLARFGIGKNLDLGLRLFFLGIQGDIKFRLVNTDAFSLALAPTLSYSRPLFLYGEYAADLPLLLTVKLGDYVKIYGGVHGRISGWQLEMFDEATGSKHDDDIHTLGVGGHLGISFGGKRWFIRPEVSYINYLMGFEEKCSEKLEFSWWNFAIGFGFVFGVEDEEQTKQIKDLQDRLERLEREKAERNTEAVRERADEAATDTKEEEQRYY